MTRISRSQYFLTLNISEKARDRAIVTIEHQQEVIGSLSNGNIFNDLHGPGFQGHSISEVEYLTDKVTIGNRKPYLTYEMVPCLVTLTVL